MDTAGFDSTRWDHGLLIGCFVGLSILGLSLSWRSHAAAKAKRKQAKLARRLAVELSPPDGQCYLSLKLRLNPLKATTLNKN